MVISTTVVLGYAKLILKYWKQILLALLLIYIVYSFCNWLYQAGYDAADDKWIKAHNKEVSALNRKIAKIETDSKAEAKKLKAEADDLKLRLDLITGSFPTIVVHDATGNKLKCEGKEVVPYLGPDFTESWNRLNEEGEMK